MYCGDDVSAIVGDVGSCTSKFGYAGEDMPKVVLPSVLGRIVGKDSTSVEYIAGSTSLNYPREGMDIVSAKDLSGSISNWDSMEKLWQKGFEMLNVDPTEHPVMTSVSTLTSLKEKEKYVETIFEKFNPPCMFIAQEAVLSAFSFGRSNALVIECGANSTRVVPVCEGHVLLGPSQTSSFGGNAITLALKQTIDNNFPDIQVTSYLEKKAPSNVSSSWREYHRLNLYRDIKESLVVLSETALKDSGKDIDKDMDAFSSKESYELPDGKTISLAVERFQCAELMMEPSIADTIKAASSKTDVKMEDVGSEFPLIGDVLDSSKATRLPRMLYDAIQGCDPDLRREIMSNMLLCGGNSLISGLPERLHGELTQMIPSTFKLKFVSSSSMERQFSVFVGGSILASLGSFQQLWVSRKEYEDLGAAGLCEKRFT